MRKRLLLLLIGVALVLVGGWLTLWLTGPKHRITRENIDKMKVGMTQQEIEVIFGVPPGNYSRQATSVLYGITLGPPPIDELLDCEGRIEEWVGDRAAVKVCFDARGRALTIDEGFMMPTVSLLDKLRWWLGL